MSYSIEPVVYDKINEWLSGAYDEESKSQIKKMLHDNPEELSDSFYRNLEFGTGGLRGIMGVGPNRMNKYTVGMATQGFANYLKMNFSSSGQIKVAVAYDSRHKSKEFAQITSEIFAANDIKVYLFDNIRPTPELSFAIRYLKCQGGVMITASHNPKEYNGYKAYWEDGGQLVNPHDTNVIEEVSKITKIEDVKTGGNEYLIEYIGEAIDQIYLKEIKSLTLSPQSIKNQKELKIVYTPLHGTGTVMVPRALYEFGFQNINAVKSQSIPDGNFPTVVSPNPEEKAALEMAVGKAREINADLVLATDPDADRVGVAVKDNTGNFILLNGNQTASILVYYILKKWKDNLRITGKEFIVKTIVTSELLRDIALDNGVECFDVLTGFKYIADTIKKWEGEKTFIVGGEESYGYLIGDFVRDKDAVSSCCMIAEITAWAADQQKTLYDVLIDLYLEYGLYKEELISITKKGKRGLEEISQMMENYRQSPPKEIDNSKIICTKDYLLQKSYDLRSGKETNIDLPKSDVLQFFTENGDKITIRPSGTEPKIKIYIGTKNALQKRNDFIAENEMLVKKVEAIREELGI